jgi:hypothetical protein
VIGRADQPPQELLQVGPLDRLHQRVEVGTQLGVGDGRALREVGEVVLALHRGAHALDRERAAVALVDAELAEHAHDRTARADGGEPLDVVPDHGFHRARDVAQAQLQERLAGAPLAAAVGPHDEDRVDLLTV